MHAAAFAVLAAVLVAAGQPLFTEDAWWYLSMGEAYLAHGPWLDADPLLHTAQGPPAPAAWLFALALAAIEHAAGFTGLRLAHVLLVAGIFALAWRALRRASGSARFASLGTALFAALSAYRLFQLRPHLVSIAAALGLAWLILEPPRGPSRARIVAAAALCALWANLHAAFVLGPALVGAALAAVALASLRDPEGFAGARPRLGRLATALALCVLATLFNPEGLRPYSLYFAAGTATPELSIVADEWAGFGLLRWPVPSLPPSLLSWAIVWALGLLSMYSVVAWLRERRRAPAGVAALDPALIGVTALSFAAMLTAVRFAWLAIFPLQLVGQRLRARTRGREGPALAWVLAVLGLALLPGFVRLGAWPMISRGVSARSYARPYPATKSYAHVVWFLRDTALEGRLFNDYAQGNFLGYWLAPRLRVFVNGSLNLPREAMAASRAIVRREGLGGASFLELLDAYGVDVFLGTGVPALAPTERPLPYTTSHLEGAPGWIPVFRNVRSAVYLRAGPAHSDDLARVEAYYARAGVPFERERGFDTLRVIREAPNWAVAHGVIPTHFRRLEAAARSFDPTQRRAAQSQLASVHLALGLYERAERLDRWLLTTQPAPVSAARGRLWALLHQRRVDDAVEAATRLEALAGPDDRLSGALVTLARRAGARSAEAGDESDWQSLLARTPVFTAAEARRLFAGYREPDARLPRD